MGIRLNEGSALWVVIFFVFKCVSRAELKKCVEYGTEICSHYGNCLTCFTSGIERPLANTSDARLDSCPGTARDTLRMTHLKK